MPSPRRRQAEGGISPRREKEPLRRIYVALRKRPRIGEAERAEPDVVTVRPDEGQVSVSEPKTTFDGRKIIDTRGSFTFDHVFDEQASNARVYVQAVKPVLDVARKGGSAVFFAFGQTGSGKTHTMMGTALTSSTSDAADPQPGEHGLYALAARDIIGQLRGMRLCASFYEIYAGKLFDLLNDRAPIQTLEDEHKQLHLVGLSDHPVSDHGALLELMRVGGEHRSSGSTHVNERSSRSHAVLVFTIRTRRENRVFAKISFIDLAGSERAADTLDLDKKTKAEGAEINRSLLALKECVRAMYERKRHIPFRGSKLTQVLRDSFYGSCTTTVMIANVSPSALHCDDTMNTLKYTDRIKEMQSDVTAQVGPSTSMAASPSSAIAVSDSLQPSSILPQGSSFEPELCDKCGFPILEDRARHVCPKIYLPCKYCRLDILSSKLEQHVKHECLEAPVSCPDCGMRGSRGQMQNHAEKCPSATVSCPHCLTKLHKRQIDVHIATACPAMRVPCTYCRANVARKDMPDHVALCPQRQVACPACGFLVKQGGLREHQQKGCLGGTHRSNTTAFGASIRSTASRLPPLPSGGGLSATPKAVTARRQQRLSSSVRSGGGGAGGHSARKPAEGPPVVAALSLGVATAAAAKGGGGGRKKGRGTEGKHGTPATGGDSKAPVGDATQADHGTGSLLQQDQEVPLSQKVNNKGSSSPPQVKKNALQVAAPSRSEEALRHRCPFAEAGCDVSLQSEAEVVAHVEGSVAAHLMLVHTHALSVQRENVVLREQLRMPAPAPPTSTAIDKTAVRHHNGSDGPSTGGHGPRTPPASTRRQPTLFEVPERSSRGGGTTNVAASAAPPRRC